VHLNIAINKDLTAKTVRIYGLASQWKKNVEDQ
jgi:Arc/MetJ family transcription regulator